jgi:hypothetical protein
MQGCDIAHDFGELWVDANMRTDLLRAVFKSESHSIGIIKYSVILEGVRICTLKRDVNYTLQCLQRMVINQCTWLIRDLEVGDDEDDNSSGRQDDVDVTPLKQFSNHQEAVVEQVTFKKVKLLKTGINITS